MPSVSKKQHNLMEMVAHNKAAAKRLGIPQSVGKDFVNADKGKTFSRGGDMKDSKAMVRKEMAFMKKKKAPASMMKHEMTEGMGMKKGGLAMRGEGIAKKGFAKGGMADNSGQSQGETLSRPTGTIPGEKVNVRGVGAARSRTAMIY